MAVSQNAEELRQLIKTVGVAQGWDAESQLLALEAVDDAEEEVLGSWEASVSLEEEAAIASQAGSNIQALGLTVPNVDKVTAVAFQMAGASWREEQELVDAGIGSSVVEAVAETTEAVQEVRADIKGALKPLLLLVGAYFASALL